MRKPKEGWIVMGRVGVGGGDGGRNAVDEQWRSHPVPQDHDQHVALQVVFAR
jgi:hypothetical protein